MGLKKRPAILFYPGDWLRDTALRSCSMEARGLWIDMICFMHDCTPYGYLKVNNKIISEDNLGVILGLNLSKIQRLVGELVEAGVCSIDKNNCYYSKRMVEDDKVREKRARGGLLGGNPALKKSKKNRSEDNLIDNLSGYPEDNLKGYPSLANTTTNKNKSLSYNKSNKDDIHTNTNIVVVEEVNLKGYPEVNLGYSEENYNISTGNQHLEHPLEVCMWNYFNNKIFDQARGMHCIRLNLDPDPAKCEEKLQGWAAAFNRGQVNDGKTTMAMAGAQESWLTYFPNWAKKVIERQGYINPEKLFTSEEVVAGKKNRQNGGKKNAAADRGPEPDKTASPEEWERWFYGPDAK